MRKRTLLIILVAVLVAGGYLGYREWNRDLAQAAEVKAQETLSAQELFTHYTTDEAAANARFNDKVVQVNGTVREVNGGGVIEISLERGTSTPVELHQADSIFRLLGAESVVIDENEVVVSLPLRIGRSVDRILESTTMKSVKSIEKPAPVNVLLETGDPLGAVVCEFPAGTELPVKAGAAVTVKGFCAGYNLDVLLQRCAIVE